jgi:hypothetical protein
MEKCTKRVKTRATTPPDVIQPSWQTPHGVPISNKERRKPLKNLKEEENTK